MKERIIQKYIEPLKRKKTGNIGIELELPIVHLKQQPVDFSIVHAITNQFVQTFHPILVHTDDNGDIANVEMKNGDIISFDCSYNTLEFSFAPESNMYTIKKRFETYYTWFQDQFKKQDHALTGMGINPHRALNHNVPIPTERYRMLYAYLQENNFPYPNYGFFACAAQVQLDADMDSFLISLQIFHKIEPYLSVLFANSILDDYVLARDWFWKVSMHGINPKNVGDFDVVPTTVDEMVDYIASQSIYCVMRDGIYLHFDPIPFREYVQQKQIKTCDSKGKEVIIQPTLDDIAYLCTFKLDDLTYRGTIEHRSLCMQPISEVFGALAFLVGMETNKEALMDWQPSLSFSRAQVNKKGGVRSLNQDLLIKDCKHLYHVAYEGLCKRGYQEEKLLERIAFRFDTATSPALDILESSKSMEDFISIYQ